MSLVKTRIMELDPATGKEDHRGWALFPAIPQGFFQIGDEMWNIIGGRWELFAMADAVGQLGEQLHVEGKHGLVPKNVVVYVVAVAKAPKQGLVKAPASALDGLPVIGKQKQ